MTETCNPWEPGVPARTADTTETCGSNVVEDCTEPIAVYIEWRDKGGSELASAMCHNHAARLRAGEDVFDWCSWDASFALDSVILWRNVQSG